MSLFKELLAAGSVETSSMLSKSELFNNKDQTPLSVPIINMAFSGYPDKGFQSGIMVFAGQSKSFKTLLGLYCMKAYLEKHKDAVVLYYDSEFGSTPAYFRSLNIDTTRIIHIPILNVEELKFDAVARLEKVKRGDKVFVFVDSMGMLASNKEIEDAKNEKSVADMTRAKGIRSFFRIITPHITSKDIPCIIINHTYETMELYSKTIVSGGTSTIYAANEVFILTKQVERGADKRIVGYHFVLNVEKSRTVQEKSKFPFTVMKGRGILKNSGLIEIAEEAKIVTKPSNGWYAVEGYEGKFRYSDLEDADAIWQDVTKREKFLNHLKTNYILPDLVMEADNEPK